MQKFSSFHNQEFKRGVLRRQTGIGKVAAIGLCLGGAAYGPALAFQNKKPSHAITCKLEKLQDNQRSGETAFTVFVPTGWVSKNTFIWQLDNGYFADFSASTSDHYSVDVQAPMNVKHIMYPGGKPSGPRLTNATDYLHMLVENLQQKGGTEFQKLKESDDELPLTDWQKPNKLLPDMGRPPLRFHRHGLLKISFNLNGVNEIATLETTVSGILTTNHTMLGIGPTAKAWDSEQGNYVVGPTMVAITPENPSPNRIKEAQIFASTPTMTPQFNLFCAKLRNQMAQQALYGTELRGRAQREMMEEHTANMMNEFRGRMADRDANSHDFQNYILDRADYKGPDGNIVTIPYMYDHSYSNGHGEYILNADPSFDPRGYGSGGFVPMVKTMHGQ